MDKPLSEQEWVYRHFQEQDHKSPLVLGTKGTWRIGGKKAIILVALTMPDIMALRDIHQVPHNPIRKVKYRELEYYAVNIIDETLVGKVIREWM